MSRILTYASLLLLGMVACNAPSAHALTPPIGQNLPAGVRATVVASGSTYYEDQKVGPYAILLTNTGTVPQTLSFDSSCAYWYTIRSNEGRGGSAEGDTMPLLYAQAMPPLPPLPPLESNENVPSLPNLPTPPVIPTIPADSYVYTSTDTPCTPGIANIALAPGQTKVVAFAHLASVKKLTPGRYTIEIGIPGYNLLSYSPSRTFLFEVKPGEATVPSSWPDLPQGIETKVYFNRDILSSSDNYIGSFAPTSGSFTVRLELTNTTAQEQRLQFTDSCRTWYTIEKQGGSAQTLFDSRTASRCFVRPYELKLAPGRKAYMYVSHSRRSLPLAEGTYTMTFGLKGYKLQKSVTFEVKDMPRAKSLPYPLTLSLSPRSATLNQGEAFNGFTLTLAANSSKGGSVEFSSGCQTIYRLRGATSSRPLYDSSRNVDCSAQHSRLDIATSSSKTFALPLSAQILNIKPGKYILEAGLYGYSRMQRANILIVPDSLDLAH